MLSLNLDLLLAVGHGRSLAEVRVPKSSTVAPPNVLQPGQFEQFAADARGLKTKKKRTAFDGVFDSDSGDDPKTYEQFTVPDSDSDDEIKFGNRLVVSGCRRSYITFSLGYEFLG